jgi:MFS family permease
MMTVFGVGAALGGPTAGLLADRYGWPLAFWSQLPVILFCATIVSLFLPEPPIPPTHTSLLHGLLSLDWAGVVLLLSSTASLILGLSFHTSYFRPWSHPSVYGLLLASALSLALFVWTEKRAARPIVPMALFKTTQLRAIWTSAVLLMIGSQALLFHVPTYFAVLMNMPAAEAGWVLSVCSGIGLSTGTLFAG